MFHHTQPSCLSARPHSTTVEVKKRLSKHSLLLEPGASAVKRSTQGANPIKPFTAVIYEFLEQARVFLPGKPFQPSLMFAGKARAYPRVEILKGRKEFYRIGPGIFYGCNYFPYRNKLECLPLPFTSTLV